MLALHVISVDKMLPITNQIAEILLIWSEDEDNYISKLDVRRYGGVGSEFGECTLALALNSSPDTHIEYAVPGKCSGACNEKSTLKPILI